ncbi:MAG: preprotein translocase subunit YajC [Rariglobus sp.]|nr:preprotein translocase subunit YajC [Rariglobus sp.]
MSLSSAVPFVLAQQSAAGPGNPLVQMLPFILIFGAMYFLMIAPQRKKAKEHAKMLESLSAGDQIVTAGGIYGEITNKKDDVFVVRIAEGTKVEIGKAFVHALVKKAG